MKKEGCPDTWLDAFLMLEMLLERKNTSEKQVVFLYELPWMDTHKSGFITAWIQQKKGTQIDLIIERKDHVVNMCEIKFYGNDFRVNKDYYKILLNRQELLSKELSPKIIIHNTLITTYGLKYSEYSNFFDNVITMDDLFT